MPEVEISCVQCRENFIFAEKEQQLFYQRNMPAPQRCSKCRSKRASKASDAPTKFEIMCDNCGKQDRVPFQPKTGRAIFCRDCHQANRSRARTA